MTIQQQIEEALAKFWDENAIPVSSPASTSSDYVAPMDSMSAVEVLIAIDEIVGFEVKADSVIRKGGYDKRDQFIGDITSRVLAHIAKEKP
jgi:acyl carrier protein